MYNRTGFWQLAGKFYSPDGLDGGGGSGDAGGADSGGSAEPGEPSVPDVVDVDENRLIRVKGSDKPVKFGDHVKGFQSQFTKASQKAAQLERELATERAARQQWEREKQAATQQSQQAGKNDIYSQLEALPFLDGKSASQLVQSIGQQIGQRDQILLAALEQIKAMKQTLSGLNQTHVNSNFNTKIGNWLKEGGYPDDPDVQELAKEIYLAYEGDDLDNEFPQIFKNRWDSINRVVESQRQQKISRARNQPFVPGQGGRTGPTKPMQFKGDEKPSAIADRLWESIHGSET